MTGPTLGLDGGACCGPLGPDVSNQLSNYRPEAGKQSVDAHGRQFRVTGLQPGGASVLRDEEVAGSNPVTPTNTRPHVRAIILATGVVPSRTRLVSPASF